MQLAGKGRGQVRSVLGLLAASLFAPGVQAQDRPDSVKTISDNIYFGDEAASVPGTTHLDTAVLFYKESGGRVQAIEPATSLTWNGDEGEVLKVGLVYDSLTGASPCGALPLDRTMHYISVSGVDTTVTNASGFGGYYKVPANTLPLAPFHDRRVGLNASYSFPIDNATRLTFGGGYSKENDFTSVSGNLGLAKDLGDKNTTLSLGVNYELDKISPYFGIPLPFGRSVYTDHRNKTVAGVMLGFTQVMNRNWLAQINYNYGRVLGYQTDPYRAIMSIDATLTSIDTTLFPPPGLEGHFESRPERRVLQSLYVGNKIAFSHAVTDISARLYHDSWGITSGTFEAAERVPLNGRMYIEPHFRYYAQSKANFFTHYLIMGEPLPAYASSDSRLGKFTATTFGLKTGFKIGDTGELYLRGDMYRQHGEAHPAGVVPVLARQSLFSGVKAVSIILGYGFDF
jgi:hypothetical protein